jgi:putative membrane protein
MRRVYDAAATASYTGAVLAHASPLTSWSVDPLQLAPLAVGAFLYVRRARTLGARGQPVPLWKRWLFGIGVALLLVALVSPVDALGEDDFFFAHMLQHVLLGDLAPLCIVASLSGPLLRPVLAIGVFDRLRVLAHPLVALPLWAVNLYVWHAPFAYEGALHHDAMHALQHVLFFTCGALMWAPLLEILPGPAWFGTGWKMGYVVAVRLIETVFGNVFLWSGTVFYSFYEHGQRRWGISPLADQGIAGSVMMIEGSFVTLGALAWLFLRLAKEGELRQELIEQGVDPRAVQRAVRYGRGEGLSSGLGSGG